MSTGLTDSGVIVVAAIGSLQAITIAVISVWAKRAGRTEAAVTAVGKDAKAAKEQVVNNHTTNMREENDSRHAETLEWFGSLSGKVDRQGRRLVRHEERLDNVEEKLDKDTD